MRFHFLFFLSFVFFWSCSSPSPAPVCRVEGIVSAIHDPASRKVLVACHRGDWRNYPENSLAAIESVIRMGADIVEIDLALTSDSVLVVCHDRTLNRTTTGRGLIAEIPYDSIQRCFLKSGHGVATSHRMPTLREALELCKDRIVVNIDKGYQYYDLVQALSEELGVTGQLLIKGKSPVENVSAKFARYEHNMMYMPIIDILKPKGQALFAEYLGTNTVPLPTRSAGRNTPPLSRPACGMSSPAARSSGSTPCGPRSAEVYATMPPSTETPPPSTANSSAWEPP